MTNYDDDLFEYDPSLENQNDSKNDLYNESVTPLSKEEKTFFENLKNNFEEDPISLGNIFTGNLVFADSFQYTLNDFIISQIRFATFSKSVTECLDEITQGKFSLINFKNNLETTISRSMHVLYLTSFLNNPSSIADVSPKIIQLMESLNIKYNSFYLKTCFHSTLAILQHKIILDRELYRAACSELQIDPSPYLFLEPTDFVNSEHADNFENSEFLNEKFSKINAYLSESSNLISSIGELFPNKNVSY